MQGFIQTHREDHAANLGFSFDFSPENISLQFIRCVSTPPFDQFSQKTNAGQANELRHRLPVVSDSQQRLAVVVEIRLTRS